MQRQLVACRVGAVEYALPIEAVREIIRAQRTHPFGEHGADALGVVDLRGQAMPVRDLGLVLGVRDERHAFLDEADQVGSLRIVVTATDGGSSVGWLVDGVEEVLEVDGSAIEPVTADASHLVREIAHVADGRLLPILDLVAVIAWGREARRLTPTRAGHTDRGVLRPRPTCWDKPRAPRTSARRSIVPATAAEALHDRSM